jgi:flagellar basal-body rod modification protein FlgD
MSQSVTSTGTSTSTTGTSSTGAAANQSALSSLTDNYQTFLQMLLTQLQNQDPTSPMDSGQFTTELVQFAGVEQQISTNSNLTQLIQLTQDDATIASTSLVGKQVDVTSTQLSLQGGTAEIAFSPAGAEPVAITVSNATGQALYSTTVNATAGNNTWTWNGQTSAGAKAPDGAYTVTAQAIASDGSTSALPFSVVGQVTGVTTGNGAVTVALGSLTVDMSKVTAIAN